MIVVRTHDGYSHMIHLEPDGCSLLRLEALSHILGGRHAAEIKACNNSEFGHVNKTEVCETICGLAEHMFNLYRRVGLLEQCVWVVFLSVINPSIFHLSIAITVWKVTFWKDKIFKEY